jgi:diacylglycerol kinase family enzyme
LEENMEKDQEKGSHERTIRRKKAKLIFNPGSGIAGESPVQLMDVISAMQAWNLVPEAYLVEPGCNLPAMVQSDIKAGIRLFVVCGGDGTIDVMAGALAGTTATLGIIPTGTQNNVALSLGIPSDIPAAIAILRTGQRIKVDVGLAVCGGVKRPFLEVCSVGLLSALFPAADDIQHGKLSRVGDFLATLVSSPPAEMHLVLDGKQEINTLGHVVLVSNTTYIGPHFQVGTSESMNDGLLDVLFFADLSKMDLLGYAVQASATGDKAEDDRIQHFHVRRVEIDTHPAMPVMVDGLMIAEGSLSIHVQRRVLSVMVGAQATERPAQEDVIVPGQVPAEK